MRGNWPDNLLLDLNYVPQPANDTLESEIVATVKKLLTPTESFCVFAFYKSGFTYEEIAHYNDYGLDTGNIVKEVIDESLLRINKYLSLKGLTEPIKPKIEQELRNITEELKQNNKYIKYLLDQIALLENRLILLEKKAENTFEEESNQTPVIWLDDVELSVRSYNILKRAGYNTLNEVISLIEGEGVKALLKVRNCGKKSLKEILDTIYEYTSKDYRPNS